MGDLGWVRFLTSEVALYCNPEEYLQPPHGWRQEKWEWGAREWGRDVRRAQAALAGHAQA